MSRLVSKSNNNNNDDPESESVTTIAERVRESRVGKWKAQERTDTHKHTRTFAEHVTQNIFFFYFPVVAAKFNTYDLYMNFDIDFFAFQHL